MPEYASLPNAWWLFWWGVALLATVVLAVWFVRAARRAERLTEEAPRADADPDG